MTEQEDLTLSSIDAKATEALRISQSTADQVMGLAVSQQRTEASLLDHKVKSEERHNEVMAAIEGAKSTDAKQAAAIEGIRGEISNTAIVKIAGAVAALIMAIVAVITALAPVLPQVVQARYATPVVVTVTAQAPLPAPSAAPAVVPTSSPTTGQVTP